MLFIDIDKKIVFGTAIAGRVLEVGFLQASLENQKL